MTRWEMRNMVERLGSDAATAEEKTAAVTDFGRCLICGEPWTERDLCRHDEIQVIALLRAQLAQERRARWFDDKEAEAVSE